MHYTCAPLVVATDDGTTELWMADGGLWRYAVQPGLAAALGTRVCERPNLVCDAERAALLGVDGLEEGSALAECGSLVVTAAGHGGVWTIATTPDGFYHVVQIHRQGAIEVGTRLENAWPLLSRGGTTFASVGFNGAIEIKTMRGESLAKTSYAELCKRVGLPDDSASTRGSGLVALAMPRAPNASPVAISTRRGVIFWEPSVDRVTKLEGVALGASLAFGDDDREIWLVENGRRLFRVEIGGSSLKANLVFELRGPATHFGNDVMLAASPVISPCGRLVLVEFACQVPRGVADQAALNDAMARHHTEIGSDHTQWSLHKSHVVLDTDQHIYCEVDDWKLGDLSRCVWIADPVPRRFS